MKWELLPIQFVYLYSWPLNNCISTWKAMYNFWLPPKLNYSQIFASMDSITGGLKTVFFKSMAGNVKMLFLIQSWLINRCASCSKKIYMSRLVQFKPMLSKDQLYLLWRLMILEVFLISYFVYSIYHTFSCFVSIIYPVQPLLYWSSCLYLFYTPYPSLVW